MRSNADDNRIYNPLLVSGLKLGATRRELTGNITLDRDDSPLLLLDPGGSNRNITLPTSERGLAFVIANLADAAESLVVKDSSTTIATLPRGAVAIFFGDGTTWYSDYTNNSVLSTGNSNRMIAGKTTVTGTADVTSGLTTVTSVVASLGANASLNASMVSAAPGGVAGHIDLKVWKPTGAGDATPIASATATDVYWIAWGT